MQSGRGQMLASIRLRGGISTGTSGILAPCCEKHVCMHAMSHLLAEQGAPVKQDVSNSVISGFRSWPTATRSCRLW